VEKSTRQKTLYLVVPVRHFLVIETETTGWAGRIARMGKEEKCL